MATSLARKDATAVTAKSVKYFTVSEISALSNDKLFKYLQALKDFTQSVTQDAAAEFLARFKQAKKSKQPFAGYKDFNRACANLIGYSGRQIRNIAAGTPTPKIKAAVKPLTPEEKTYRAEKQALQDKIDLATAARVHARELSNLESQIAAPPSATVVAATPAVPVTQKQLSEYNDAKKIQANEVKQLEAAVESADKRLTKTTAAYDTILEAALHLATLGQQAADGDAKINAAIVKLSATFLSKYGDAKAA